jgi:hypothetical protein
MNPLWVHFCQGLLYDAHPAAKAREGTTKAPSLCHEAICQVLVQKQPRIKDTGHFVLDFMYRVIDEQVCNEQMPNAGIYAVKHLPLYTIPVPQQW